MNKLNSAPAFIVWIVALGAILTPPQVTAAGFAALLEAQHSVFELLIDEPAGSQGPRSEPG